MKLCHSVYQGRLYFWKKGQIFSQEVKRIRKSANKECIEPLEGYQSISAYLSDLLSPQKETNLFSCEIACLMKALERLGEDGQRIYLTQEYLLRSLEVFISNPLWVNPLLDITQGYPKEARFLIPDRFHVIRLRAAE